MKLIGKTAVFCMLCLMSVGVNAQEQSCGDGVTWNYENGTLRISYTGSGTGAMCDYSNSNPGPWNDNASDIDTIIIGAGVTYIGYYAFYKCESLTGVTIPQSVTGIGDYAFGRCTNLSSVTFADGINLTGLGGYVFSFCSSLTDITLPGNMTSISTGLFYECSKLTSFTFPAGLISIGFDAFDGTGLTSVSIPASVTSIGDYAFYMCDSLKTLSFADGVNLTSIGESAFSGCISLTSVTLPDGLTNTSDYLFYGCKILASVTLPESLESIGAFSFYYCALTSVNIPASVTTIGTSAFVACDSLTDVYVNWTDPFTLLEDDINSIFYHSNNENLTLHVPYGKIDVYKSKNWAYPTNKYGFANFELGNLAYLDGAVQQHDEFDFTGGPLTINDNNLLMISFDKDVEGVDISYTRTFSSNSVWQAWYMPFDADYETELSEKYYVAQILGVFMDAGGNTYITFQPMTSGTVKANTPYVVKPKTTGDVTITVLNATIKNTQGTPFTIQSSTKNFTFGGVYEKTVNEDKGWYAINKEGNFQALDTDVYLKPMRIWMTIADRDDNPYATPDPISQHVGIRVIGDTTTGVGLTRSDEQQSGDAYRLSEKIVIRNGKKYLR